MAAGMRNRKYQQQQYQQRQQYQRQHNVKNKISMARRGINGISKRKRKRSVAS